MVRKTQPYTVGRTRNVGVVLDLVCHQLNNRVFDLLGKVEVFTRRALLKRDRLGLSTVGGQASLNTLVDEPDFALASFLLSVMGEGTFLTLLRFLEQHAPDPVTRAITRLANDEARHVAFGVAHLRESVKSDPALLDKLTQSVHRRHDALRQTAGLNQEVLDALVLLAAGAWDHDALRTGSRRVTQLIEDAPVVEVSSVG